jgi:palmitoyl-protein thioesterase
LRIDRFGAKTYTDRFGAKTYTERFGAKTYTDRNPLVQSVLFQADYFREPTYVGTDNYKRYSQMASWNNEDADGIDPRINERFAMTSKFAMIKANGETEVIPNEGEWWGAYEEDFETVLTMRETAWDKNDLFGELLCVRE